MISNKSKCTIFNKQRVGCATELNLYHGEVIGSIVISQEDSSKRIMMAKGDAIELRDALNKWLSPDVQQQTEKD